MNAIIGYSEMLIEDAEDEGNDETAERPAKRSTTPRHAFAGADQ